jgi:CheY-like chemotaxis protein
MAEALKILIVDDEEDIIYYLSAVLGAEGFECISANSAAEAIGKANAETFFAVLSDMSMPKMTGLEMVPHIRASSHNSSTPVIILSGALTDEHLVSLEKLGVIDVMSKPPDVETLVKLVHKASKKRTKKTGKTYAPEIVKIFHEAFVATMRGHLSDKVSVASATVSEVPLASIEHCGMVVMVGRRLSGVLTISFETGFTLEFAKTMMGAALPGGEMSIFEAVSGEMAEQVTQSAVKALKADLGLHLDALSPMVVHGRFAAIPLSSDVPRLKSTATVSGKNCYLEFALVDMSQAFAGREDRADVKIIQNV